MRIRATSATLAVLATSLLGIGLSSAPAEAAAPSNDLIANATAISGESGSVVGTTVGATWTAEDPAGWDPDHSDPSFTNSVWYQFTAPDDLGLRFTIPYGQTGISVGTFVSYNGAAPSLESDDYSAIGWSAEVAPGENEPFAAYAGLAFTDTSHDDPVTTRTYYVRVKTTAAAAGPFTLTWTEGGLPTSTTATATADHAAGTFRIDPSTMCTRSFYGGPPPTPVEPADSGYYIVRDENGTVVGSKRRWELYDPDGTTPATITGLPLVPGSHTYTVRYYFGSPYQYCARSQAQVTVVDAQPTITALRAVINKQKVTFTGTVAPAPPAGSSIQVLESGNSVVGLVLTNGSATGALTGVRPGKHTYTGWFGSPFPAFASSYSVPITVTVPKYTTTTYLTAPRTAKVRARPAVKVRVAVGRVLAKGSVVFRINGRSIGTRKLVNGTASLRLPKLKKGKTAVSVIYMTTTLNASSRAGRVITVRR